ncbi:hypothetical protein D3C75_1236620 [compost metagenome]
MPRGKQVGQVVIGKRVHCVGQFQLFFVAAGACDNRLLEGGSVSGDVRQQCPLAKVVGVVRGQLQVAA